MANFYRLIIFIISLSIYTNSYAEVRPAQIRYANNTGTLVYNFIVRLDAIKAFVSTHCTTFFAGKCPASEVTYVNAVGSEIFCSYKDSTNTVRGNYSCARQDQFCGTGATISGTFPNKICTDTCPAGQFLDTSDNTCQPKVDCTAGRTLDEGTYRSNAPTIGCIGGCSALFAGGLPFISCSIGSSGVGTCDELRTGKYVSTGELCAGRVDLLPRTPSDPNSPENKCAQDGKSFQVVNGQTLCVANGTAGTPPIPNQTDAPKTQSTTSPTGVTTSTSTSNVINNNGNVTTTITTTTTNADGSQTQSTQTKSQDQISFCEQNGNLGICKSGSGSGGEGGDEEKSFGGVCASGFNCAGDAIQCAIAREQHLKNCILYENETSLTDLGQQMIDGDESANPAKVSNRETMNISNMVQEGSNIGGGTFQDKVIAMPHGGSVTLPFSQINFVMQILGTMLLAAAYINAARIVGVR